MLRSKLKALHITPSASFMNNSIYYSGLIIAILLLLATVLGCSQLSKPDPEWTKARKIAGKEQKLSHISGIVLDDKFAYATIGGTIADQNEGTSGLRKIALDSGEVTILDDGKAITQTETGGIAIDEKFIYWNMGGKILRISKEGGPPETVASENVGIGIDMAIDNEKVYWANHGYYSSNGSPAPLSPIYMAPKQGGKTEIFTDGQKSPGSLAVDEKFVYWVTPNSILKQAKSNGQPQIVYQAGDKEGIDKLQQDAENLYFGFRGAGEPHWALRKISKQGGEAQTLAKTFTLVPFSVDETNVYFFDEHSMYKDDLCRVSKNGGEITKLDTGYAGGVNAQSKSTVYFWSLSTIYSFTK